MPDSTYVIDSNVLINFYSRLQREDILYKVLGGRMYVTERVRNEALHHAFGIGADRLKIDMGSGKLPITNVHLGDAESISSLGTSRTFLHEGEKGSAVVAKARGWGLITDDRRAAEDLLGSGITIHDSRWVLRQAESRRYISKAEEKRLLNALARR